MQLNSLKLLNFRNYDNLYIDFNKKVNLLVGKNGQGKTNIVESIYMLSFGKSFRTNKDKEIMPFQIGGHPGFHCPLYKEESYDDYELVFEKKETCTVPTPVTETGLIDMEHRSGFLEDTDTLPLKHDLFSVDAVILDQLKSRAVTLKSKKHNKGIRLDFEQFPYLILWSTAKEADFVAMEPWIGLSTCSDEGDKFEEKRNIQYVQAGEVKEYEFHINIL